MSFLFKLFFLSLLVALLAWFLSFDTFLALFYLLKRITGDTFSTVWSGVNQQSNSGEDFQIYNVVSSSSDEIFTKEELSKYDGEDGSPGLYLGILGRVYDVESGRKYYGAGGGYGFFSGKSFGYMFQTILQ